MRLPSSTGTFNFNLRHRPAEHNSAAAELGLGELHDTQDLRETCLGQVLAEETLHRLRERALLTLHQVRLPQNASGWECSKLVAVRCKALSC